MIEALQTDPEVIANSRPPDKVEHTDWYPDNWKDPNPPREEYVAAEMSVFNVLRYEKRRYRQRRMMRRKTEIWYVGGMRVPYIIKPMTIIAGDDGNVIGDTEWGIRDIPSSTIARSEPEYRYYEEQI